MNVVEINRTSHKHNDYYGIVKLTYDEVVMISNALYKYHKNTDSEAVKQISGILKEDWDDFRDMLCYGKVLNRVENSN